MTCRKPRTVGFQSDGKTIAWSQKTYSKEYPTWQMPCGYCLPCRLKDSGGWATRALHEASLWDPANLGDNNCFITLTYSDPYLDPAGLRYDHFQTFMKDLRNYLAYRGDDRRVAFMVAGEYGALNGRPHWHACIFNWSPSDAVYSYTTDLGHKVYTSQTLGPANADEVDDGVNRLWNYGKCEFGSVTYESASYISRYATKERFGELDDPLWDPIFNPSRGYAIGKRWLEKYYTDIFNCGYVTRKVEPGVCVQAPIPRYYERWFKNKHFNNYLEYLVDVKYPMIRELERKDVEVQKRHRELNFGNSLTLSRSEVKSKVLESKIKQLRNFQKL